MSTATRGRLAALTAVVLTCPALVVSATSAAAPAAPAAPAAGPPEVPAGFQDTVAIGGLSEPTAVAFAAYDDTAFIALKTGVIKSFDYDQATGQFEPFADHVDVINLDVQVNNYWDRGLTGIAVDPQFGTAGNNFVYVNYAYNRDPRDNPAIVPKWGTPGQQYDECSAPAAMGPPVVTGCLINSRVSRIPVAKQPSGWVASGPEQPLLEGACMQFPSHASGDVAFGPDGYLYASAGDGASFDTEDYGQAGNPCPGDPVGEGGSLRSQDIRTPGDPLSVSGAIFRMNKANGNAPNGSTDNADRIVTVGQRNPWRLTFRPGTSELWSSDVGGSLWEEINRTDMASFTGPVNLGWPCYEGSFTGIEKQPGWEALDTPICEDLYAEEDASPGTVAAPHFSYQTRDGGPLTPGENCQQGTSSISGVAFIPSTSTYPAEFRGSLFFNDYARGCIWRLGKLPNGDPDPNTIIPFVEAAETPVGLEVGPGGDLFYVDYGLVDGVPTAGAGGIHRIVYTPSNQAPVAALTASAPYGPDLLSVDFDASGSTDADDDPLSYEWALDGDGVFDDGGGATRTKTYSTAGPRTVHVRVSDGQGGTDTEQILVTPGNTAPTITSMTPAASLTWAVGDTVSFSATATDAEQSLPDSAYTWSLSIQHCPSVCHTHPVQTWVGQRTGSFQAPDHEYPSNLLLQVTVTDDQGLTDVETRQFDPKSVDMTFASDPAGAALTVAGNGVVAPHDQTFIQGSGFNVSAPETREVGGAIYTFTSWSDGGARSHSVVAPASATTMTATYTRQNRPPTVTVSANPTSGPAPLTVDFSTDATDPDGDNAGFTYEWALDGDGVFDDGGGATKQKQYATAGARNVQVRVTDSHGGQDTDQVTVTAGNTAPVLGTVTPTDGARWSVGEAIAFSATATDEQDGALAASAFAWTLEKVECASGCDPVEIASWDATSGDSLTAPDLAYPSHLLLTVTVTDSRGLTDTETVRLDPRTVDLSFASTPPGLAVPLPRTVVVGSSQTISVPDRQYDGPRLYRFAAWSDGGARTHVVTAPATDHTYRATYEPVLARVKVKTRPRGLKVKVDGKRRAHGWATSFAVGVQVKVVAPKKQWMNGVRYEFVRWSDGGRRVHSFVVPESRVKLRAVYRRVKS